MRVSDLIEEFIKERIKEKNDSEIQIQRNELANYFSCAPSQINYVLTTRFTTDKGYYIESKRGGGGCITLRRVTVGENKPLIELINDKIGDSITYDSSINIINSLYDSEIISLRESNLIKVALNARTLSSYEQNGNRIRADMFKSMLLVIFI